MLEFSCYTRNSELKPSDPSSHSHSFTNIPRILNTLSVPERSEVTEVMKIAIRSDKCFGVAGMRDKCFGVAGVAR